MPDGLSRSQSRTDRRTPPFVTSPGLIARARARWCSPRRRRICCGELRAVCGRWERSPRPSSGIGRQRDRPKVPLLALSGNGIRRGLPALEHATAGGDLVVVAETRRGPGSGQVDHNSTVDGLTWSADTPEERNQAQSKRSASRRTPTRAAAPYMGDARTACHRTVPARPTHARHGERLVAATIIC
jgi:hypothetical protein